MSIITAQHHKVKNPKKGAKNGNYNNIDISIKKFLNPSSPISKLSAQFFFPKQHDYNQNVFSFYSTTYNFVHKSCDIINNHNEKLYSSLFYKVTNKSAPKNCIIYCHGFGSTRLQAVHILKVLPQNIALCCFDFSGSGKSQGDIITYGAKQKQDIQSVIAYLKQQINAVNFILWGRSMGATSCLLYSLKNYSNQMQSQDQNEKTNIIFQVIDSAFVSFQKIAIQMAKKFISIPQFGTSLALDMMREQCDLLGKYNPFTVNLQTIQTCKVPTLFIYSEQDEIVSCKNSEYLTKKYTGFFQKIIINQGHNAPRSTQTLGEIMKKIQIQLKKCQITRKNGVMFRSFMSAQQMKGNKSAKKGIQRSFKKQQKTQKISRASQKIGEISPRKSRNSDYGLKVYSKCQTPNPHSFNPYSHSQQHFQREKVLSYSTMPHDYNFKDYQSPFVNNTNEHTNKTKLKINFRNQFQKSWTQKKSGKQDSAKGLRNTVNIKNSPTFNKKSAALSFYQISKKTNPNNGSKMMVQKEQKQQNIYQMRKPEIKKLKNNLNSIQHDKNFLLQQSKNHNEQMQFYNESVSSNWMGNMKNHRQDQRKSLSGNKKLNISLSMMKVFKDRSKDSAMKSSNNCLQIQNDQGDYEQNILKMDPKKLTFRPTTEYQNVFINKNNMTNKSQNKKKGSLIKSSFLNTTKPTSMSSSMDNLRLLGAMKQKIQQSPSNNVSRQHNNQFNNDQVIMTPKRCVKKMRSSQVIYYDRASYRYGI